LNIDRVQKLVVIKIEEGRPAIVSHSHWLHRETVQVIGMSGVGFIPHGQLEHVPNMSIASGWRVGYDEPVAVTGIRVEHGGP